MRIGFLLIFFFFTWCTILPAREVNLGMCTSYINMYCSRCHTTERICIGLKTNDKEGWQKVLQQMAKNDPDIDKDVQEVVHACLTSVQSVDTIVCAKK